MNINNIFSNEIYDISYSDRGAPKILIIFASAGLAFGGGPILEFKNTLLSLSDQNFDVCWVVDKNIKWYNSDSNDDIKAILKKISQNKFIICIGESMGGCGAMFFGEMLGADRIIAMGPQFSMLKPFINFNTALGPPNLNEFLILKTYTFKSILDRCYLFFGADSWQDFIHASFFKEYGYKVYFVKNSQHTIAHTLKGYKVLISFLEIILDQDIFEANLRSKIGQFFSQHASDSIFNLDI